MGFVVDAQLPPALARWLEDQGHIAVHVADAEMRHASDAAIWRKPQQDGSVIITKDEDFALWRVSSSESAPVVIWSRVGNTRKAELLRWFEKLLPDAIAAFESGEKLIEVE